MSEQIVMLTIPNELKNPFFFSKNEIAVEIPQEPFRITENFLYELLYYHGISCLHPWQNPTEFIPLVLDEWEKLEAQLQEQFKVRNKAGILPKMKKGIGLFIQLLFWSNERPAELKEPLIFADFSYKPVNVGDRLAFILARPELFPSFSQLSQLFIEQEKLFAKKILLNGT